MNTTQAPPQTQPVYEISQADKERIERIHRAWQAYDGTVKPPLEKMPDGTDPNVTSNQIEAKIERIADFVFGKYVGIKVEEGGPEIAQQLLDDIWGRNEKRAPLLRKLILNGMMAGHAFLRIVPMRDKTFRLVVLDPSTIFVKTAPQDCETVLLYCIEYCEEGKDAQNKPARIFYREEILRLDPQQDDPDTSEVLADKDTTWEIQHWSRVGERGPWIPAGEPYVWPYPFPPIFGCQNLTRPNDYWGKSDVTDDLAATNHSLNLDLSCINLVQLLYGQPILYSKGAGERDIDITPGKIIGLGLLEASIDAVPIASDQANALTFADNLRRDISEQMGVPNVATGRDLPPGQLSAVAIELLFMPILKKMDTKRCLFGELILEVSEALLVLNNMHEKIKITLDWQSPLPEDSMGKLQAAVLKSQIGVSKNTILRELGYNPEEEEALKAEEDAKALDRFAKGQGMPSASNMMQQDTEKEGAP